MEYKEAIEYIYAACDDLRKELGDDALFVALCDRWLSIVDGETEIVTWDPEDGVVDLNRQIRSIRKAHNRVRYYELWETTHEEPYELNFGAGERFTELPKALERFGERSAVLQTGRVLRLLEYRANGGTVIRKAEAL